MEFRYDIEMTEGGLPTITEDPNARLHIRHQDGQIYIEGDQAGLLELARCLISLALTPNQPTGYHYHLEPGSGLDSDSTPVVIYNDSVFSQQLTSQWASQWTQVKRHGAERRHGARHKFGSGNQVLDLVLTKTRRNTD